MTDISLTDIPLPPSLARDLPRTTTTTTTTTVKGSRSVGERFKPESLAAEKEHLSRYFDLSIWQIAY